MVASAAAEVPFDALANLLLSGRWIALQEVHGRHDHSGRAVTTLKPVHLPEAFLQRMELLTVCQAFNGCDFSLLSLDREHSARLDRVTVQKNGASPALAGVTPDVGTREAEHVSEVMNQK